MTTAVIETVEHKVISCMIFHDAGSAGEFFKSIVKEYGVEPTDELFDDDAETAWFDDDGDYTVQMIPVSWGNPKGFN